MDVDMLVIRARGEKSSGAGPAGTARQHLFDVEQNTGKENEGEIR